MGLYLGFSNSSFDDYKKQYNNYPPEPVRPPNPDPSNFEILNAIQSDRYLVLSLLYPDCTNYEGKKILVFKNCSLEDLLKQNKIDPHFSNTTRFHSPIARFEPTSQGWMNAILFVKMLNLYNE